MQPTPRRLAVAISLAAFVVLALTAGGMPIVWDEGEYLWRASEIVAWCRLLIGGGADGGLHALSHASIVRYWHFVTWTEGHPAWCAVPTAISQALFGRILRPLMAARIGPMAVYSAACGAVAFRLRKIYGTTAAVVAAVALLTFPRLFSEAHFATQDGQLTAWWLMLWAADASLSDETGTTVGVGVLAGLVSATKFTGWIAWLPLVASRLASSDRRRRDALWAIIPIGLFVFYLANPPLWHQPVDGMITHVQLNLHRTLNVPIVFLGGLYDLHRSLPWYNTIAWLVMVAPVPLLVLGAIGLVHCARTRDAVSISLLLHWVVLMIVRALPGTPPHDGIRLFLPAFGFWCVLAGVGAQRVWSASHLVAPDRAWRLSLQRAAIVVGLAAGAVNLARYYPQTLSHYSLLVGGVRGAASLGMEPTYWWDALDTDAMRWLNDHTDPGAKIAFSSTANIGLLRSWGWLRPEQADRVHGVFQWYVFQNRTSFLAASDRLLMQTQTPAYTKYAGHHRSGREPAADLNVPLLLIYSYDQYKAAVAATSR